MTIDATFWVAISFFIFFGVLIYLKVPQKINNSLTDQINKMRKELDEAEKLKVEAKNLLSNYENKIDKSKKETQEIIRQAKNDSEKAILEKTKTFHQIIENRKKGAAILLISTELEEILSLSDRITVLYEGELMGMVPRAEVDVEKLGLMMGGSKLDSISGESKGEQR